VSSTGHLIIFEKKSLIFPNQTLALHSMHHLWLKLAIGTLPVTALGLLFDKEIELHWVQ